MAITNKQLPTTMANGQKRAKLKKALSPPLPQANSPPDAGHDDLLDDLFSELDNRSPEVQQEAATVLNDIAVNDSGNPTVSSEGKKGSKQRFKEREVLCQRLCLPASMLIGHNL